MKLNVSAIRNSIKSILYLAICSICFTGCKETKPDEEQIYQAEWIDKVGSSPLTFKDAVYYANDYGSVADSTTLNTSSIQKTIDTCAAQGGGTVTFKPGIYLTGSIFVKEGVKLLIPEGVELRASTNINDYTLIDSRVIGVEMKWPAAVINVNRQKNAAVEGKGLINAQGRAYWDQYLKIRDRYQPTGMRWAVDYDVKRPHTIQVINSENIIVKDITIKNSAFWSVHTVYSNHITIDGVIVKNVFEKRGPGTKGIDIDSSSYILVQNCDVDTYEDNYALKAGRDWDGLRVNKPTEYVVIKDCKARSGYALCGIGSETSGNIRHILITDMYGKGTVNGLSIRSALTRGGTVEDIHVQNIKMDSIRTFLEMYTDWNPSFSYPHLAKDFPEDSITPYYKALLTKVEPKSKGIPVIKDITITNVQITDARRAVDVNGTAEAQPENITLRNIDIQTENAGQIMYSKNWKFENTQIKSNDHFPLRMRNTSGIISPIKKE